MEDDSQLPTNMTSNAIAATKKDLSRTAFLGLRKYKPKAAHFIQHLAALNFANFSNVTWKLLEKQWKKRHVHSSPCKSAEKLLLIMAANTLLICTNYSFGVFISLAPLLEQMYWDEGTLKVGGVRVTVPFTEAVGIIQSSGQGIAAIFGVIAGCCFTVTKSKLKGRILIVNLCTSVFIALSVFALMMATDYWSYYGAYVVFMAGHGVVSSMVMPTQLLVSSTSKQIVMQGITLLSKYGGMVLGMAVTTFLYEQEIVSNITYGSRGANSLNNLVECIRTYNTSFLFTAMPSSDFNSTTIFPHVEASGIDLHVSVLWYCMGHRMRSFFPSGVLAILTTILFFFNPRLWKYACSSKNCCPALRKQRFRKHILPLFAHIRKQEAEEIMALQKHQVTVTKQTGTAQVTPIDNDIEIIQKTNIRSLACMIHSVDLDSLSDEEQFRLIYDSIFGADRQYLLASKSRSAITNISDQQQRADDDASTAYLLHNMCKFLGIESSLQQARHMTSFFDTQPDNVVTFEEFVAGFQRIKPGANISLGFKHACNRTWCSPHFVLLAIMSTVATMPMHGVMIFSIIYQINVFESSQATESTIMYVTAGTAFAALLLGVGGIYLGIFQKLINETTRSAKCCGITPNSTGRVLTQASMGYVSLLVLASSGAMLGAWALNTNIVHFWVMQTVAMSLLLTLYSTIRAMIVDTVKPKDYSLGLSQSSLISQLVGATPAALVWGLIANMDSSLGESGAWFVFALIPLIIIPFAIAMVALLTPKLLKQRALKDNAIRMMAQALAVQGERRRKMVEETFFNYAEARSTQGTIAATFSKEKRKLTIDSKELSLLLEDILQESLAETPIENEDAMKLREMRPLFKRLIREEVVPIIFKQVDSNTNGVINFVEFCEGLDDIIQLIAHPALSNLSQDDDT